MKQDQDLDYAIALSLSDVASSRGAKNEVSTQDAAFFSDSSIKFLDARSSSVADVRKMSVRELKEAIKAVGGAVFPAIIVFLDCFTKS